MQVTILPSALMDIAKMQFFYENIEEGLGVRFCAYLIEEIDKLTDHAGIDEMHFGFYRALANRFHQSIYYKIDGDSVIVWRVLDQRFRPGRIAAALKNGADEDRLK